MDNNSEEQERLLKAAQIEACMRAVTWVLRRIRDDERLRELLAGSHSYRLLTTAYALYHGEDVASVQEQVIPGSSGI